MAVLFQSRLQLQICLIWIINSLREHGLLDENDDSQDEKKMLASNPTQ